MIDQTGAATPEVTEDHSEHHPSDRHYVNIAVALAVITGLEVATYYLDIPSVPLLIVLFVLMAIKFFMVASQFMHLKFDSAVLSRIFYGGLFLAVVVYLVALSTFRIFNF
jgi:cytochrome c oxidase subunit 4